MNSKNQVALLLALLLTSCTSAQHGGREKSSATTMQKGRDFDTSKVKEIQKGKTTTQEIVELFGQPVAKRVISTNQVGWLYAWKKATLTVTRDANTSMKGKEVGYKKWLDLLIADDVVVNYTFDEGPFETAGEKVGK